MIKKKNPKIEELELSYTGPEYWYNRTLPVNSSAWSKLRKVIIEKKLNTCRFCKIKLSKYIVVDHVNGDATDNSLNNLNLNCPACDSIRHCGLSEIQNKLIIGNSELTQVEIVKKSNQFYIENQRVPFPEEIDSSYEETKWKPFEVASARFEYPRSLQTKIMKKARGFFTEAMWLGYLKFRISMIKEKNFQEESEETEELSSAGKFNKKQQKEPIFAELNEQQKKVVLCTEKRVCVIAGPGCGKTKTLVARIVYLLQNYLATPAQVVLLTFSRKSVKEIKERIGKILNPSLVFHMTISNLHSFCYHFLRKHISLLGFEDSIFPVYDRKQQEDLVKNILAEKLDLASSSDQKEIRTIVSQISFCKVRTYGDSEIIDFSSLSETHGQVALKYQEYLNGNNILDFNDLLLKTLFILKNYRSVREEYQKKFSHLMIDEFQDVNDLQWEIISLLTGEKKNLLLVGDPNQSIYGFQGSSPELIASLEKKVHWRKIYLQINYRSPERIVKVGNDFLSNSQSLLYNPLKSNRKEGGVVKLLTNFSISNTVEEIISLSKREKLKMNEIAVLYRSNYLSNWLEQELVKKRIPYEILGSFRFIEREEIKDVLAYLRAIVHQDDWSVSRVLKLVKGIGLRTIKAVEEISRENKKSIFSVLSNHFGSLQKKEFGYPMQKRQRVNIDWFVDSLNLLRSESLRAGNLTNFLEKVKSYFEYEDYLQNKTGSEDRVENVRQLMNIVSKWEEEESKNFPTLRIAGVEFLNHLTIAFEDRQFSKRSDNLILSTIHQVKGLEFKAVFFVHLDEGSTPNNRSNTNSSEEKRIFYVGITRAKEFLYLISNSSNISVFLSNIKT